MITALLFLAACAEDVAKDKPVADVAPAAPAPAPTPAPAPAAATPGAGDALVLDKARSTVKAVGAKITGSHELTFTDFSGALRLDGETVTGVDVTVKTGSVETDSPKLVTHLKSEDFFAADQFPDATFASTAVTAGGEGGASHTVKGNLTIRGTTKEITFPATLAVTPEAVTGHAEFAIVRGDFGVVFPGKPDDLIQDNVLLKVDLVSPRAPAK